MIIVIGSVNLDLIATVARLPRPGETVPGERFSTAPGGKGANQALAAARAGGATRMIGAVGKDAFAKEALALLEAGGVDLTSVAETHASTGTALILVQADGENVIAVIAGANASVLPGDVAKAGPARGDVVLMQQEIPVQTIAAGLKAARAAEAASVLNVAPFVAAAAPLLAEADYVVANEAEFDLYSEALGLIGDDRLARMRAFAATSGRTMIVTLGKDGVLAATPKEMLEVAALPITPVDTVGAGDTFCGFFGAALAAGLPLAEALARAAAAGSLACLKPGAQPAIPSAADVDAALAKR